MRAVHLLCIVISAFLVACGGGSESVAPVADVTFLNVQTDPNKTTVVPGEKGFEVAAFRMSWKDPQQHAPISQLVFTNQFTDSLWTTFKDFTIIDGDGKDITSEAPYNVRRDDATHKIIVDFYQYAWFPNDFGAVPRVYSLIASLKPGVIVGTTFAFKLDAVQMHDIGKTVTSEVNGGQVQVMKVADAELPVITTTSSRNLVVDARILGQVMPVGSFSVTCPAGTALCTLTDVKYFAGNMSEPMLLSVDGAPIWLWYSIPPGVTRVFTVSAIVYNTPAWISVIDMTWLVGARQTKVNPVVPTGQDACDLIVVDTSGCKG